MKFAKWWAPVLFLIFLTPFSPALDLEVSRAFYTHGEFASNSFLDFMYSYGVMPANAFIVLSISVLLFSFFFPAMKKWRNPAIVFLLTVVVGAGLIVHATLKDHWGRPRPKQTIEFGGTQEFRPYYKPNFIHQPEPSKSFSCGHCTMGFCFFALMLAGKRMNSRILFYGGFALAVVLGVLLSYTRIAQGGHFLSDTIVSALIMWLTALCADWIVFIRQDHQAPVQSLPKSSTSCLKSS